MARQFTLLHISGSEHIIQYDEQNYDSDLTIPQTEDQGFSFTAKGADWDVKPISANENPNLVWTTIKENETLSINVSVTIEGIEAQCHLCGVNSSEARKKIIIVRVKEMATDINSQV